MTDRRRNILVIGAGAAGMVGIIAFNP